MYKAPEMLLGQTKTTENFQSDLWALGGVIAELYGNDILHTTSKRAIYMTE